MKKNYFVISSHPGFTEFVSKQISDFENDYEITVFLTQDYEFGLLQLLTEISNELPEASEVIYIIDSELRFKTTENDNSNFAGTECAMGLRSLNKFRSPHPIILSGFCPQSFVEESVKIRFSEYGFHYLRLPFNEKVFEKLTTSVSTESKIYAHLPELHLLGLIDDHYADFEKRIETKLNEPSLDKNRQQKHKILSFPYDSSFEFAENNKKIKKWLCYTNVLDTLLLDLNFDHPKHSSEDVYRGGREVLRHLEKTAYSVPVTIMSISQNADEIKNVTLDYHQLVADYIKVESFVNEHSKTDIKNIDNVVELIIGSLKKTGAYRNKIGILITHGTDTMAWTNSLLKYSLKDLNCNVVLTGSQIPLKSEFSPSDAPANILSALHFLNQYVPPQVGVSFDMGKKFFTDNLKKVRIWNENAFDGTIAANYNWQDIETSLKTLSFNNCLDTLYLLTTGGTIAMDTHGGVTGHASLDVMENFFRSKTAKYRIPVEKKHPFYNQFISKSIANIDSSEMNPEVYSELLSKLHEVNSEYNFVSEIDTNYRWDVFPILCSPFFTNEHYFMYKKLCKDKNNDGKPVVFILVGYGAGNLPYDESKRFSPMSFVKDVVKNNIVIITSQVQQEIPDLDYEVSIKFINEGVLFGGEMSLAEIMIKSAYLLGHYNEKEDTLFDLKSFIMAGVHFRSKYSKERYINRIDKLEEGLKYIIPDKNYFKNSTYTEAKVMIKELIA